MHGCACVGVGRSFLFLPLSVLIWFCCISPIFPFLCAFFFVFLEQSEAGGQQVGRVFFFVFFFLIWPHTQPRRAHPRVLSGSKRGES